MILSLMLREEYRLHASYSSRRLFLTFPLMIVLLSALAATTVDPLEGEISADQTLVLIHASALLYGISVGAFGFLGRGTVERSQGRVNFLVAMPASLPLSYRRMYLMMYLRDIIYYFVLMLVPALIGLLISVPVSGFSLLSIALVSLSLSLSFLIGISLSFLVSVLYVRGTVPFVLSVLLLGTASLSVTLGLTSLDLLIPSLGMFHSLWPVVDLATAMPYAVVSLCSVLLFSLLACLMVPEEVDRANPEEEDRLPHLRERLPAGRHCDLVAKELTDVLRSGAVGKMTFSFVLPLLILGALIWYVNSIGMPVGFNSVFYAAIAGFFGVSFYSWLTNMDHMDYYSTLPVSVPMLIRAKLTTFLLLTIAISTVAVVSISMLNGERELLWLALPVMVIMTLYMVTATAYLTGLSPNSSLFDPEVLTKFMVVSFLPDVCLTILSFSIDSAVAVVGIALVCTVLLMTSLLFYRSTEERWSVAHFD